MQTASNARNADSVVRPTLAQARAIPPLSHREAMGMARLELERFLALVTSLSEDEWEKPTACPLWNVRQILAHVTGAAASYARWSEFKRQNSLKVQRPYRASGLSFLESLNQIQVDDRACATPAALIVATDVSLLVHVTPRPTTVTGVKAFVVVPFPSRPSVFRPQHCREPS